MKWVISLFVKIISVFKTKYRLSSSDLKFIHWCYSKSVWEDYVKNNKSPIILMDSWNKLHGDKLLIKNTDSVQESINKMRKIYDDLHSNDPKAVT